MIGPVLETCDGCGACCLEQGAPPDYVALRLNPHFADDPTFAEDAARLAALPDEARQALDQYLSNCEAPGFRTSGPCVWYEPATFRCRFYEYRPSTCRVFERNSPGCHIYRRRHGRLWYALNGDFCGTACGLLAGQPQSPSGIVELFPTATLQAGPRAMNETPYCQALVICDVAYRDSMSGKWFVMGTYDRLTVPEFPARSPVAMYLVVTDGRGKMPMTLRVVDSSTDLDLEAADAEDGDIPGRLDLELSLGNPLEVVQGAFAVPCSFERPGAYKCELWINNEQLMSKNLVVVGPAETRDHDDSH